MKKILFYYSQLNIGGAEKSLIRLMNALSAEGNDVTLLCRYGNGKGEYLLDNKVQLIKLSTCVPQRWNSFSAIQNNIISILQRFWSIILLKLSNKVYDITLIGLQGLSPEFIYKCVNTNKIAVFIRNDISKMRGRERVIATLKKNVHKVDYYICVAGTVKESLIREIPELATKSRVIYNILNVDEMKRMMAIADAPFSNEKDNVFRIITVCRIVDKAKGIFRMVRICKILYDEGFKFRWYVVGDGQNLDDLRQLITENSLEKVMITPGRIDNPFGYYRDCNMVAMLSYYEGLCGVVNEAKMAGKPIVATMVSGIKEQLTHGVNGWIVENDEIAILEGMRYLLSHPSVIETITNDYYPDAILNDKVKIEKIKELLS